MASISWKTGASGDWNTGSNWTGGVVPGPNDIVSIAASGSYTVTITAAAQAYTLDISDPGAVLVMNASLSLGDGLTDQHSLIDIAAGTLSVAAGVVAFGVAGATSAGADVDGPGTLSTASGVTTTINAGYSGYGYPVQLILGGGVTWSNSGTVFDQGSIQIGDGSGETATIVNNAGAVFQFLGPDGQIYDNAGATGIFQNMGTIDVDTATNVALSLTNTGLIDLQSGDLNLSASSNIGGTVSGGGILEISGGASVLTAATSGNLLVAGGVLTLEDSTAIMGNVSETSGGIYLGTASPSTETLTNGFSDTKGQVSLAADKTLALTGGTLTGGTVTFGVAGATSAGADVDGPGTLSTSSTVTTTINAGYSGYGYPVQLILGGGVTWSNSGTVFDQGSIQIGDGSGETATIVNNADADFQFLGPDGQIYDNAGATGIFQNMGTIDVGTAANFALSLTNTGLIDLQSGVLNLSASSNIGGTVSGGGILEISGGASVLTAATSGNLLVAGGVLTLEDTTAITGNVSETSGGIYLGTASPSTETLTNGFSDTKGQVSLAADKTLALTGGTVTFGVAGSSSAGANVDGPGTLSTASGVTTTINAGYSGYGYPVQLILGGGVTWSNSGTVSDQGSIQIGDGSGETATIVNNAGAVFQFLGPDGQIYDNAGASGSFVNKGTIVESTSGGSVTSLGVALNNTGTIDLESGSLNIQAGSKVGGTVTGSGGTLQFSGGASTLTATTSANVLVTGGALTISPKKTFSGQLTNNGGTVLFGKSVKLSGVLVDQSGLVTLEGNTLSSSAVTIDSAGTLSGYGTISAPVIDNGLVVAQLGTLALGANASGSGAFDIAGNAGLEFLGAATVSNLTFLSGGAETLLLAQPGAAQPTINGFGATDAIDLVKTTVTGLSFANGTLTAMDGGNTVAVLDFDGQYSQSNFGTQSDGNGGTDIIFKSTPGEALHYSLSDFHFGLLDDTPLIYAREADMDRTSFEGCLREEGYMHTNLLQAALLFGSRE